MDSNTALGTQSHVILSLANKTDLISFHRIIQEKLLAVCLSYTSNIEAKYVLRPFSKPRNNKAKNQPADE